VPGLLGTGEDGAKLSSCDAADGGVAVLMEGSGLLGGVCRSVCDRDSRVGEFGPGSEPAEDQAVMKLRTAREEGQVVAWKNKKGAQGDVPLGLGMFAGIPGCRTGACQCDFLERFGWKLRAFGQERVAGVGEAKATGNDKEVDAVFAARERTVEGKDQSMPITCQLKRANDVRELFVARAGILADLLT
jgi:hypothetical protein